MTASDFFGCFFGAYLTMAFIITVVAMTMGSLEREMADFARRLIAGAWLWPLVLPFKVLMAVGDAVFGRMR